MSLCSTVAAVMGGRILPPNFQTCPLNLNHFYLFFPKGPQKRPNVYLSQSEELSKIPTYYVHIPVLRLD